MMAVYQLTGTRDEDQQRGFSDTQHPPISFRLKLTPKTLYSSKVVLLPAWTQPPCAFSSCAVIVVVIAAGGCCRINRAMVSPLAVLRLLASPDILAAAFSSAITPYPIPSLEAPTTARSCSLSLVSPPAPFPAILSTI